MKVIKTKLEGLIIIEPQVFGDARGFFFESYQEERYQAAGIDCRFVQDNQSLSKHGVLRGLHYQLKHPQDKLVSVLAGKVLDVAVDIRKSSPTFGQWVAIELSAENHRQLFVPKGFAHGFSVLSESAHFYYKCSDYYHPEDELGILWSDPDLGIEWQIENPELAEKDKRHPRLKDCE